MNQHNNKNNHRSNMNNWVEIKINRIEQPTKPTTIRSTRVTTSSTKRHLPTDNKQTNWLLALYWIKVNELEIIDGHGIGFITGTKWLDEDKQGLRMDILNINSLQ